MSPAVDNHHAGHSTLDAPPPLRWGEAPARLFPRHVLTHIETPLRLECPHLPQETRLELSREGEVVSQGTVRAARCTLVVCPKEPKPLELRAVLPEGRTLALGMVPVREQIPVVLTFDDGPSAERQRGFNPTEQVLEVLSHQSICAAFFVLTGPDVFRHWLGWRPRYPKAETEEGFSLLVNAAQAGHVLGVHWGGRYGSQHVLHPNRVGLPPYDIDGDGIAEGSCALESDLLQCRARIREALGAAMRTNEAITLVRAPLWVAHNANGDARPIYAKLGLTLVGTDAKLFDGGYPGAGYTFTRWLVKGVRRALADGVGAPVLTMHDSNPRTARDLPKVLRRVREAMNAAYGDRWCFAGETAMVRSILETRQRYRYGCASLG